MGCAFTVYGRFGGTIVKVKVWEMICEIDDDNPSGLRYSGVTQTHTMGLGMEILRNACVSHAHHSCKVY